MPEDVQPYSTLLVPSTRSSQVPKQCLRDLRSPNRHNYVRLAHVERPSYNVNGRTTFVWRRPEDLIASLAT